MSFGICICLVAVITFVATLWWKLDWVEVAIVAMLVSGGVFSVWYIGFAATHTCVRYAKGQCPSTMLIGVPPNQTIITTYYPCDVCVEWVEDDVDPKEPP